MVNVSKLTKMNKLQNLKKKKKYHPICFFVCFVLWHYAQFCLVLPCHLTV